MPIRPPGSPLSSPNPIHRVARVERHALGPRVYILGRRVHEWMLGGGVLFALAGGRVAGRGPGGTGWWILVAIGLYLIAKDWRDLAPAQRDTAAWRLGIHRRVAALRAARRGSWVPPAAAAVAATAGVVNLLSALTPGIGWRGRLLLQLEPVAAIPIFHALAVPASALLIAAALYLQRRRRRACQAAIALLVGLGVLDLVKGLDIEEALLSFAVAGVLVWGRESFHVRHEPLRLRAALWRVPAIVAAWAGLTALAVFVAAPGGAGALAILRETGDLLLWQAGPLHFRDELGQLPLAVELMTLGALLAGFWVVLRPLAAPGSLPDAKLRRLAGEIVRRHGADTLAFFKLRRDKHYLFSADRAAFVGYRIENRVLLLSGDPVGEPAAIPGLVRELCAFADLHGLKVAALGSSAAMLPLWEQAGLRAFYIGDEGVVDTHAFSLEGRQIRKVRQSVARLDKAGYTVEALEVGELDARELAELEALSARWLDGGSERGFSMALDGLGGDEQADTIVVVGRDGDGRIRGFVHYVPSYGRPAMSLAAMRRDRETPNGLMEFLVVRSIELLRERGVAELSLNFAAFARTLRSPCGRGERALGRLVALANPYFQIESLYRFNTKFFPRWEPRYLVYEGALGLPRAGLAAMRIEGQLPARRA